MHEIIEELNHWLSIDGVEGIGIGMKDGKHCIIVSISIPRELIQFTFPDHYKGMKVFFEETSKFSAQM
jgi:hypothetical protein